MTSISGQRVWPMMLWKPPSWSAATAKALQTLWNPLPPNLQKWIPLISWPPPTVKLYHVKATASSLCWRLRPTHSWLPSLPIGPLSWSSPAFSYPCTRCGLNPRAYATIATFEMPWVTFRKKKFWWLCGIACCWCLCSALAAASFPRTLPAPRNFSWSNALFQNRLLLGPLQGSNSWTSSLQPTTPRRCPTFVRNGLRMRQLWHFPFLTLSASRHALPPFAVGGTNDDEFDVKLLRSLSSDRSSARVPHSCSSFYPPVARGRLVCVA